MSTSIITASYNNTITVSFTNDAWFNATEVAKQYDKRPTDWTKLDSTKEYIANLCEIIRSEESSLLKVVRGGRGKSDVTWFHPDLAVPFARWLNVKFSIWCDMQIKKILQEKTTQPDPINEPLKIPFATKEQREPLVKAVRGLVLTAKSKGRNISFEEAHQMVNFSIGVTSVEEMTVEMIPTAIKSVGELLRTIVLEGDYIAKGEPEPETVEPKIPDDPFTNKEREQLHKIVGSLAEKFHFNGVWTSAIHCRLRQATGRKSPAYYCVSDKPVMADTFEKKIFPAFNAVQNFIRKVELECAKRIIRDDAEFEAVIADLEIDLQSLLTELESETKTLLDSVDRYQIKQFAA